MQLVPDIDAKEKSSFLFKDWDGEWCAKVQFSQLELHSVKMQFFGDELKKADKTYSCVSPLHVKKKANAGSRAGRLGAH